MTVGYGATHRKSPRAAKIATIAVGYADGYLRSLAVAGNLVCRKTGAGRGARVHGSDHRRRDDVPERDARPGMMAEIIGDHRDRRPGRRGSRHHRLRDPDRARPALSPARRSGPATMTFLAGIGRTFLTFLTHTAGGCALSAVSVSHCLRPPFYPAADRPPADRDRLLLAARGRADDALHRHGAGAAELFRLRPLQRRERHCHRGRPVDHARSWRRCWPA